MSKVEQHLENALELIIAGQLIRTVTELLEVWRIMQMLDRARAYPYEWPKFRTEYAQMDAKADACEECGSCEESCPFDLKVIERLKKAHEQFNRPV